MPDYSTQEVNVNEQEISRLVRLYKSAYKKILAEVEGLDGFAAYQRRQALANIKEALEELGVKVNEFVADHLTEHYKDGARDAVKQLKSQDLPVDVKSGFNRLHKAAIAVLVSDTQEAFAESMTGVYRNTRSIISKGAKAQITQRMATAPVTGQTLKEVKAIIVQDLKDRGLLALRDKAGREWELDRYTEMLLRTKDVEARNRGLANRMAENDYDLVQVSTHNSDHEECRVWEGRVLSITGNTKGYPTLAEAESQGLFHPNCQHAINVVIPELADDIYGKR